MRAWLLHPILRIRYPGLPRLATMGMAVALTGWLAVSASAMAAAGPDSVTESTEIFLAGARAYESGDYAGAIDAFLGLVEQGHRSGPLYYNLGNSYLKEGDLGHAILWYERAMKFMPGNADLLYNLEYAMALTRDEIENPEIPLGKVLFFWRYRMSHDAVRTMAMLLWLFFWALLAVKRFSKATALRVGIVLTGFLALIFAGTALFNYYDDAYSGAAVIVSDETVVRSGTDDSATELFRLHAGTRVEADRIAENHVLVAFTKDKVGWVPRSDIALVRGP